MKIKTKISMGMRPKKKTMRKKVMKKRIFLTAERGEIYVSANVEYT